MNPKLQQRIARAQELLQTIHIAALATVNEDNSPHNSPVFFIPEANLQHVYWCSSPESLHSKNAERVGQVFVSLFNSVEGSGGLYIKAEHAHVLKGDKLKVAVLVHNKLRKRLGLQLVTQSHYEGESPQRMYGAMPVKFWVNMSERNQEGLIIRDRRYEVTAADLLDKT